MKLKWNKADISVNKQGFTIWVDGLIVGDCPIERAEAEPQIAVVMLKILHEAMYEPKEEKVND